MKIVAVVVTYNRKELLKECIEALLNKSSKKCDVLVIDNNSNDGTYEYIKKYIDDKKIIYKNTGSNLGGAGGFNYGMKEACKLKYDYIWVMDDDCIVEKDSLEKLLEADKKLNGNYGFLSSKVLWKDGSICNMNIPKKTFGTWLKNFDKPYQKIAMASFVSLFLKREVITKMGLPIKDFFIWTDDWEFTRRISREYNCYYIPESKVIHKSKNNFGAKIEKEDDRLERFEYLYRNDVVLYRREGVKGWFLLYLRLLKHKLNILKSDKKNKKERIKIIDKAIKEGKKFYPKIEKVELDEPIRVLEAFGEPLSNGGQDSYLMNMYRNIDRNKVQFDFFTPYKCYNDNGKKEFEALGGRVYIYGGEFDYKGDTNDLKNNTKKFFEEHKGEYNIVHIHSGSTLALMIISKIARKSGVENVIVHSHCGGKNKNLKYRLVKLISAPVLLKYPTKYCACSKHAAEWKFPKSIIKKNKYTVLKNAIDTEKIYYSEEIRNKMRKELKLENKFVVGHIGRFTYQKNHSFLIDIFNEILKKNKDSVLLLIGTGQLQDEIKEKVKSLGIEKNVRFLEIRRDINELLNSMDVFLFPSLYEGIGIVGIEAEATGLPLYTSNMVPKEFPIEDLVEYYPLEMDSKVWAENILNDYKNKSRRNTTDEIIKSGYDVKIASKILENIYLNMDK